MSRSDRIVAAAGAAALVLAAAAAWLVLVPAPLPTGASTGSVTPLVGGVASVPPASAAPSGTIVVDVQGAVTSPGVRELPAGSRVADAISAAGGYGPDADLAAASSVINLAEPLADGAQIRIPRIGDGVEPDGGASPDSGGGGDDGLVDLNTATPEQLEALPGIGPVTVQKIVAARQEQPFASLEDAVERGILNRGQLEQIQGLATAG